MSVIKTTHVGSLPRPSEMMTSILRKKEIIEDDLKRYLREIIEKQVGTGLDIINNGELPRTDYVNSTVSRISGFNGTGIATIPQDLEDLPNFSRRFNARNGLITLNPRIPVKLPICTEPLSYVGKSSLRHELDMMKGVINDFEQDYPDKKFEIFFTSPSPGTIALFMANEYYSDYETYLEHISECLKIEYEMITSYGFQLQVDCPDLAMGRHTGFKHLRDSEFIKLIDTNIHLLNHALEKISKSQIRVHICWGNYAGTHHCDIELNKIFKSIININARYISIEASNHRHSHEWTVFDELKFPGDKVLLPGVIDTSTNIVEHPQLVAQRIQTFVNILGSDRVIPSTDCGFATTAAAASVSSDIAWLKLNSLVEGAKLAEKHLK
jgi:5-methyltetrahydropteroyltriglutamate--homocysteine methyltransferase